eukprot:TRINITY_DN1408_c0_g1_i2.p1 TRINITY_DN1408_c0_g1~~TRINITY_DN1408_c0_g1_i2.p1  ORF type:complete len:602 (+),score=130.76 TRINITY_DN1408_c0_g1_i2:19-1824(+)
MAEKESIATAAVDAAAPSDADESAPVAELLLALSEVLSGNGTKESRKKLRRASRDAEKTLRLEAKRLRDDDDSDDEDDSADLLIQAKTADALDHIGDILKASRALLTSSKHQKSFVASLPQFLWQSSLKASKSAELNETLKIGAASRDLVVLLFSSKDFREILVQMVQVADEIVQEEAKDPSKTGKEIARKDDEKPKRKADIRFEPILAALAENPKWFHTMKHAVELSADLQKLTGLQLEGPEAECLKLLSDVAKQVQDDETLREWMGQLGSYIDDAYNNNVLSQSAEFQQRGQQIAESLHALKKRLKKNTDVVKLFSQVRSVVDSLSEDNSMTRFYTASNALIADVTYSDRYKRTHLDYDVLYNLKTILLPSLVSQLKMIRLPHLEDDNDEYLHWTVDHAVVDTRGIVPDQIRMNTATVLDVHANQQKQQSVPAATTAKESKKSKLRMMPTTTSVVTLALAGFDAAVHNAEFTFKRKIWPRLGDSGIADVKLVGVEIEAVFEVKTSSHAKRPEFTFLSAKCKIKKLKLKLNDTKHDIMYNAALKILKGSVRQAVELSIAESIGELTKQMMASFNVVAETGSTQVARNPSRANSPIVERHG